MSSRHTGFGSSSLEAEIEVLQDTASAPQRLFKIEHTPLLARGEDARLQGHSASNVSARVSSALPQYVCRIDP